MPHRNVVVLVEIEIQIIGIKRKGYGYTVAFETTHISKYTIGKIARIECAS